MMMRERTKVTNTQANLYVRKMTAADNVYTAIETTFTKMPALYRYTEIIPKTFLVSSAVQSWDQEDVFNRDPIRRFVLAMTTNAGFLGAKRTNPFYIKCLT